MAGPTQVEKQAALVRVEQAIKTGQADKKVIQDSLNEYADIQELLTELPEKMTHEVRAILNATVQSLTPV